MKQIKVRRDRSKRQVVRRAAIVAGVAGVAGAGVHRWRHRRHDEEPASE